MRALALVLATAFAAPVTAQEKKAAKKPASAKQAAHKKASPEQIRKFNELAKKRPATK